MSYACPSEALRVGGSWGVGVRDVSRTDRRNSYPIWQEFASPTLYKIADSGLVLKNDTTINFTICTALHNCSCSQCDRRFIITSLLLLLRERVCFKSSQCSAYDGQG
jgi:hypothetical protein